jgi:hypothetical protein
MSRRRGIWIVALLTAALGAGAVVVHASAAAPTLPASTMDLTYSCRVQSQHFISLNASVTLPPVDGRAQPAVLNLTTGVKVTTHNGTTTEVSQLGVQAAKHGLKIDKSACRKVKQRIPLKPKGLPGPPTTVTATHEGYDNEDCNTTARVLFRLKLKLTNQKPSHALLAVRNTNGKPVAFYNWGPKKVTLYTSLACANP